MARTHLRHANEIRRRSHGHMAARSTEALQKGIRSLSRSSPWRAPATRPYRLLREKIATPSGPHPLAARCAGARDFLKGSRRADERSIRVYRRNCQEIIAMNRRLASVTVETVSVDLLREGKRMGTATSSSRKCGSNAPAVRHRRQGHISPVFKRVIPAPPEFESLHTILCTHVRRRR